jgi:exodeoxyribonuclease V
MELNEKQQEIHDYVVNDWIKNESQFLIIDGYAGTGKTLLLSQIAKTLKSRKNTSFFTPNFAFCSFTGKAASVLYRYLVEAQYPFTAIAEDVVSTIHSLILRPVIVFDPDTGKKIIAGWEKKEFMTNDPELIFIDEISMVGSEMWNDLLSYRKKIIGFGDSFQLPPVGPHKTNLLSSASFRLDQIHRQDENDIIDLSTYIRLNGKLPSTMKSDKIFRGSWQDQKCRDFFYSIDISSTDVNVLCGFNKTRNDINLEYRKTKNLQEDLLYPGDKIMCLRNNGVSGLRNGQQGVVNWIRPHSKHFWLGSILIDIFDDVYEGLIYKGFFGQEKYDEGIDGEKKLRKQYGEFDLFDFAYAVSVHKAQASEWDKIILFEQRSQYWDDSYYARWLYTGVTRAKKKLFLISNRWK